MARKIEINKGTIPGNALKALVKSNIFRPKTHKLKKGRGAYSRKGKKEVFRSHTKNLFFPYFNT